MDKFTIVEENRHDRFLMLPNIVDDLPLSPYELRLYVHIKRVSGENGKCWQGLTTMSKACRMSRPMVCKAKSALERFGLIRISKGGKSDLITIIDIWGLNSNIDTSKMSANQIADVLVRVTSGHHVDLLGVVTTLTGGGHHVDTKNTPINNTPLPSASDDAGPTTPPIQPAAGSPHKPKSHAREKRDTGAAAPGLPDAPSPLATVETEFAKLSGLKLPPRDTAREKKASDVRWWGPLKTMLTLYDGDVSRTVSAMRVAIERMRGDKLTISAPQSIEQVVNAIFGETGGSVSQARVTPATDKHGGFNG